MAFRIPNVPKTDTLRLYKALATWIEEKNGKKTTYRQEFIISATNPKDAYTIAHNHLPMKLTSGTTPSVKDDVDLNLQDFGIPMPNRTYYSSPIVPNTYELIKPGPVEEIRPDTDDIEPVPLQKEAVHIEIKEEPLKQETDSNSEETSFDAAPDDMPDDISDYLPNDALDDIPENNVDTVDNAIKEQSEQNSSDNKPFVTDANQLSNEQVNQMNKIDKIDEQQSKDAIETFESDSQLQQNPNNFVNNIFNGDQEQFMVALRIMRIYGEMLQTFNDSDFNDLSQQQYELYQWMAEYKDYPHLVNSLIASYSKYPDQFTNDKAYRKELTDWIQFQIKQKKGD